MRIAGPSGVRTGERVTLRALVDGAVEDFGYRWTFDDGHPPSTGPEVTRRWTVARTHVVTVSVTGVTSGSAGEARATIRVEEDEPLIADFVVSDGNPFVNGRVEFRDRSSGSPDRWQWDFGDGSSSTERTPSHSWSGPGEKVVTLVVYRNGQASAPQRRTVTVRAPASSPNRSPVATDSAVTVPVNSARNFSLADLRISDPDGDRITLTIVGSSSVQRVGRAFVVDGNVLRVEGEQAAGEFTVRLRAADGRGGEATATVTVTVRAEPPMAAFEAPATVTAGTSAALSDRSSGAITEWRWTASDGWQSTAQHPSRTFPTAGDVTITLVVTGPGGASPSTSRVVRVTPVEPVNRSPVAGDRSFGLDRGQSRTLTLTELGVSDPDNDPLTITGTAARDGSGVLSWSHQADSVTVNALASGTSGFSYTVTDGRGGTVTGNVTVTVTAPLPRPGAPSGLTMRLVPGSQAFAVSWSAPANAAAASVTGYRVRGTGPDGSVLVDTSVAAGQLSVTGGNGRSITTTGAVQFSVAAVNADGEGDAARGECTAGANVAGFVYIACPGQGQTDQVDWSGFPITASSPSPGTIRFTFQQAASEWDTGYVFTCTRRGTDLPTAASAVVPAGAAGSFTTSMTGLSSGTYNCGASESVNKIGATRVDFTPSRDVVVS